MRNKQSYNNTNKEYKYFKEVVNDSKLMMGIDDKVALEDDEAYELASEICQEVMATTKNMYDAIFSFGECLDLIADRATGFSYKILSGRRGSKEN